MGLDVLLSDRRDQHYGDTCCCPNFEESASWFLWQIKTPYQMTESRARKKQSTYLVQWKPQSWHNLWFWWRCVSDNWFNSLGIAFWNLIWVHCFYLKSRQQICLSARHKGIRMGGGVEQQLHWLLISALDRGSSSFSRHGHFTSRGRDWVNARIRQDSMGREINLCACKEGNHYYSDIQPVV